MDLASLIGIAIAVGCLGIGIVAGGSGLGVYFDLSSIFITLGGSLGSVMITTSMSRLTEIFKYISIVFNVQKFQEEKIISQLVVFSEKARRDGLLALEDDVESIEDEFFRKGIQLVVDGTDPDIIKNILYTELSKIEDRHDGAITLFDDWGKAAPSFGMIGTLLGLIAMLARLEDKSAIGAGMAQALITTLYGAVLAYCILIPFKRKLEERNKAEVLVREIIIEGVLSIQSGDNPRVLEEKLCAFLPPAKRQSIVEIKEK